MANDPSGCTAIDGEETSYGSRMDPESRIADVLVRPNTTVLIIDNPTVRPKSRAKTAPDPSGRETICVGPLECRPGGGAMTNGSARASPLASNARAWVNPSRPSGTCHARKNPPPASIETDSVPPNSETASATRTVLPTVPVREMSVKYVPESSPSTTVYATTASPSASIDAPMLAVRSRGTACGTYVYTGIGSPRSSPAAE